MQRKPTKSKPAPSAAAKRFVAWVKEQPCCVCDWPAPSIADHVYGSAYQLKHRLVSLLVGPWMIIPVCQKHDDLKTHGSHKRFEGATGKRQVEFLQDVIQDYQEDTEEVPDDIYECIMAIGNEENT